MEQRLRQALSRRQKRRIADDSLVPSAVLLPIYYNYCERQYYILFTKRTDKVKEHKGQISFPGGAYEDKDGTLLNTALRECAEEIGLVADKVEVLGELDDEVTAVSNYVVSPFVALVPWPYQFKVDGEEVEQIIEVPLRALLDKERWHKEKEIVNGREVTLYFYHYAGRVIWGATARILVQLLDVLTPVMEGD